MKINLKESLNKIDLATDNKYDLLNTFNSKKLSDNSKKKLMEAIENKSIASVNKILHESEEQLYKVVLSSGATKFNFESALYKDEAEGIVDYYDGRWIDENGFEWNMYVEEDDDSTEHAMVDDSYDMEDDERFDPFALDEVYDEDPYIRLWDRDSQEYENLDKVSGYLMMYSPNHIYYHPENTYFDYGQDWKWTTIIARRDNGDSWQAINPRQQESILLCTTDEELEEVAKDILRNSRLDKGFNESLNEDLSSVKEIKQLDFTNNRVNNLRGIFSTKSFVKALNDVGLNKFKIRTSRLKNISTGDLKDAWYDLKRNGWIMSIERDPSLSGFNEVYVFEKITNESLDEQLTEASYGGAYDIEDDMFFTKEEIVEFANNICEDLAKEFGYNYDIADVYMDSPTKLHIELIDNHDIEVDINVRIDMRRIKKPSDLEKTYHNSTLESFKNRFLEEYQYYNFDESLNEQNLKEDLSDLDLFLSTPVDTKQFNDETFRALKNLVSEYKKDLDSLDQWASESEKEPFVKKWYKLADKCKEIAENGIRGITGYGRLNDFIKLKIVDLARSVDNTFPWYTRNTLAKYNRLESLQEKLNNREKNVFIDKIEKAKSLYEIEDIIKDIRVYDLKLYSKLVHYPNDFEKAKNYILKILKNSLKESLTEDTVKQNGKWVNKGSEGTHGKFRTKKAADAQRKAMFANGYKAENLKESLYDMFLIEFKDEDGRIWQEEYEAYSAKNSAEQFRYDYPREDGYKLVRIYKLTNEGYEDTGYPFYWDESLDEQINLPGYAVKWVSGYGGSGVNNTNVKYFRTEEEQKEFADKLNSNNTIGIKTYKIDNFYHTLPKEECLEESNMSYVKKAFAFDIYKDGDKYIVINGDGDTVYESDNTLDCLKWAKKNSSNAYDFNNKFDFSRLKESDEDAEDKVAVFTKGIDGKSYYHGFMNRKEADKHYPDRLKESIDDEIDLDFETDFDDGEVEEGNVFFADGTDWVWEERIAGPLYLDFDKWAVWSARESVDIRDFIIGGNANGGLDIDKEAYIEAVKSKPIVYFIVDEDTGFIDWGPVENEIEAKDFLNGKQDDWENDYYEESLKESFDDSTVFEIYYDDIDGEKADYYFEVPYKDVLEFLANYAEDEEDAPQDEEELLKYADNNFDRLYNEHEYEVLDHFYEDAEMKYQSDKEDRAEYIRDTMRDRDI